MRDPRNLFASSLCVFDSFILPRAIKRGMLCSNCYEMPYLECLSSDGPVLHPPGVNTRNDSNLFKKVFFYRKVYNRKVFSGGLICFC